ncbi:MAG: trimethylamine methyltransferase family protein [Coriobacteriia bacterium]|nr:trimethylamine methyltransferase family protein [Coriobacteriia bacterium]MCL2750453.1 trimethylamine methyltransferase family protein [Coriobacteriia bacterium]
MPSTALNCFSPFEYLSPEELRTIHAGALEILVDVGSDLHHAEARALLEDAGATVDDRRVFLTLPLVEQALTTAPAQVVIYDRDGNAAMDLSGRNAYFGTGSDCIYLLDSFTGERRVFAERDMIDAVRLCDALPHVDFLMSMGMLNRVSAEESCQRQYANLVKYSNKPQVIIAHDATCLDDIVELAAAAVPGGREELRQKPRFVLYTEPTSPLLHSFESIDKLLYAAAHGVPTNYAPGMMAGATGPVTPAGALTLATAEILFGLVLHQLKSPGAPFVFGAGMSNIDMQSMQPSYASPEAMMAQAGLCELGRNLYRLPTWGFAGCSASKLADTQAINEAATYIFMAGLTGSNLNHDLGYLEFGLTYSFDLLVMANESVGQLRRIMDGLPLTRETMALDAIREVGPGGHYLANDHTLEHYRENWFPDVTDRNTFERWTELGATTMEERCKAKIKLILDEPPVAYNEQVINDVLEKITEKDD